MNNFSDCQQLQPGRTRHPSRQEPAGGCPCGLPVAPSHGSQPFRVNMQLCLLVENIKKQQNPSFCRDTACLAALIEELDRRGIRTKATGLADGRVRGHIRFGAGPLAHLLKNRFYIGEIVYRGEVYRHPRQFAADGLAEPKTS